MAGRAFRKAAQARAKADLARPTAAADASDDEGEEEVLPPPRPARNAFDLVRGRNAVGRRQPVWTAGPNLTPAPAGRSPVACSCWTTTTTPTTTPTLPAKATTAERTTLSRCRCGRYQRQRRRKPAKRRKRARAKQPRRTAAAAAATTTTTRSTAPCGNLRRRCRTCAPCVTVVHGARAHERGQHGHPSCAGVGCHGRAPVDSPPQASGPAAPETLQAVYRRLFAADPRQLDAEAELKRIFGARVVGPKGDRRHLGITRVLTSILRARAFPGAQVNMDADGTAAARRRLMPARRGYVVFSANATTAFT